MARKPYTSLDRMSSKRKLLLACLATCATRLMLNFHSMDNDAAVDGGHCRIRPFSTLAHVRRAPSAAAQLVQNLLYIFTLETTNLVTASRCPWCPMWCPEYLCTSVRLFATANRRLLHTGKLGGMKRIQAPTGLAQHAADIGRRRWIARDRTPGPRPRRRSIDIFARRDCSTVTWWQCFCGSRVALDAGGHLFCVLLLRNQR